MYECGALTSQLTIISITDELLLAEKWIRFLAVAFSVCLMNDSCIGALW